MNLYRLTGPIDDLVEPTLVAAFDTLVHNVDRKGGSVLKAVEAARGAGGTACRRRAGGHGALDATGGRHHAGARGEDGLLEGRVLTGHAELVLDEAP